MSYFQNVLNSEWMGVYAIADRQYNKTYRVRGNVNTPIRMINWVDGPYDTSTANKFGIKYSMNSGSIWNQINVTLTTSASTTAAQIVANLNASSAFASVFVASLNDTGKRIIIQANNNFRENFVAYIPNLAIPAAPTTSAEIVLGFNRMAPVVELPSYFERNVIGTEVGSPLVLLTQSAENFVITNAGLSTTAQADYQLLEGTCGLFLFRKQTVDGSNRVTQIIEYAAGATAGALAKKINYTYTSTNTYPTNVTEIPYTLASGDLITPP